MTCIHLQQLYRLCRKYGLKLSGSDLIHVVCKQCGHKEVCPSTLIDKFDDLEKHNLVECESTKDE
jgi:hypothetical protein